MKEKVEKHPNLLIISNECISQSGSNGRTLRNFLIGWDKKHIAQFYIRNGTPDFEVCENYYCVTDVQAVKAIIGKRPSNGQVEMNSCLNNNMEVLQVKKGVRRDALTMLLREIAWSTKRWITPEFKKFVSDFSPEVVLLQAGDCAFMYDIARNLAKNYQIPLVIYNSESYYFKKKDYFNGKGIAHLLYPIFRQYFCNKFEKTLYAAQKSIYICEALQEEYDSAFSLSSTTIYTATEIVGESTAKANTQPIISYLGNLGVGRYEQLIEVANVLHSISEEVFLDIYGNATEGIIRELDKCPGIRYKGFVSYDEVVCIMQHSDILIHVENFSDFYRRDLKFAFSTKLADSLASGTCFLLYAPEEFSCSRYLKENNAAYVVSDDKMLKETLSMLIEQPETRNKYISAALKLVDDNHKLEKNAIQFQNILKQVVSKKNEDTSN